MYRDLILIFLFFFFASTTIVFATEFDDTGFFIEQRPFAEYSIKKHPAEQGEPKSVLLLHSIPDNPSDAADLYTFSQIIGSHWNTEIDIYEYNAILFEKAVSYPYIILIELNAENEAISLFSRIVEKTDAKTMWVGFDESSKPSNIFNDLGPLNIVNINYKDTVFASDEFFAVTGVMDYSDPDYESLATYVDSTGAELPYIAIYNDQHIKVLSNLPGTYDIDNYSLPFLDIIHHLLGHHSDNTGIKPALLRLEDVNVFTYKSGRKLNKIYDYLKSEDIPFHIAFIERYVNPQEGIDIHSTESTRFINTIKRMLNEGNATLVQHGYKHQVDDQISGIGFEFWDAQNNRPLQFGSVEEAHEYPLNIINEAQASMRTAGLPVPDIWETPHYAYSDIDSEAFNFKYPIRYEHIPNVGSLPFTASINGTIFLPENLGYVTDREKPADKEKRLNQLLAFEDPVASVFWHPWRKNSELKELTTLIEDKGFTFVSAYSLLEEEPEKSISEYSSLGTILLDTLIYFVFFSFVAGALIYTKNVLRVRKYIKEIKKYEISLDDVFSMASQKARVIPTLALFIPARNESLVIGNTLRRIAKIDYPKSKLQVYVIVDEREYDDDVEHTTKEVALETANELHAVHREEFIKIVEVPKWYSGVFGDLKKTYHGSTKGRALNYCLQSIDKSRVDMLGILDADGRLHPNVLKEVAFKRLRDDAKLLQGPVFQVGNFKNVSIVGRAAALELALHHLTELPHKLHKNGVFQFLAGTNYFIDTKCIIEAGGWDQEALVEDAEIALRMYTKLNIVGGWLNSPEIEQTPANFSVYRRQRHRWVRGHIDLLGQIRESHLPRTLKFRLYNKIVFSQMRFLFDVGLPIVSVVLMIAGAYSYISPIFSYLSIVLFVASAAIWDTYGFMYRTLRYYINPKMTKLHVIQRSAIHLLYMPIFIFVQAIPRFTALYSYIFNKKQNSWYKTERTAEAVIN